MFLQPSGCDYELFKDKAADFLLQWEAFGALLMRELTLKNASSFGRSSVLLVIPSRKTFYADKFCEFFAW